MKTKYAQLIKISFWIALTSILSSCASHKSPQTSELPPATPGLSAEAAWEQNQAKLSNVHSWRSEGRIAVTKSHKGDSASFVWQQFPEQFHLRLFGPFGSGAMELEGTLNGPNKQVVMRQGNKVSYAPTAEDLLYQKVRWHLPVSGLTYWVKGIPVPNQPIEYSELYPNGSLKTLTQSGWTIHYAKYEPFQNLSLPTKMHLMNNQLEVKLVIRSWDRVN